MLPSSSYEQILDSVIASIDYTQEEWECFLQQFLHKKNYQTWLKQQGVRSETFETWVKRELAIRKFQQRQWGKKVSSYFLDRKHQLDQVVFSLVYLQDRNVAQELYFRIAEGEQSLAEVAHIYSEKADAPVDGKVGPIELGKLHPELARLFYGARSGQLWEPFVLDEWIVIARLEEIIPIQFDDLVRQFLLNELLENWLQEQICQRSSG
ncbi:peptidylprolyl isomerase [Oscillatoria sp. FACHB-1407]|uniref:peptidylprolyl isomerase n=1 Tax=Oscillatoria sp. FACHB-1407 TaxID=2692847 RepID=UPI001682C5E9|nr:peptidylprolyl isomerase [Oscillatoria sp. FACHB-1407]MBD2459485.1 peptidylprolyl isomerase [Oscillatoria sp. FACHB-1407]